jgi:hypothetical protein
VCGKRRFGYSRDHLPDCVQIIIALVVTPEGLPLTYEVLPGLAGAVIGFPRDLRCRVFRAVHALLQAGARGY